MKNPAYLIEWFRAGRPGLARGPQFRGRAHGDLRMERGGLGRAGSGLEPGRRRAAHRQQPAAPTRLEYWVRDVSTLT